MLRNIIKRFRQSRYSGRILAAMLLVMLYFLFIGFISELVNQNIIERDLKDWFEKTLDDSTFINIDHTDTALRSNWRTDLYIHELEVASPSPEFVLPAAAIDTVRASSGFYTLFGAVKATPVIQIRDGILNIERTSDGRSNLSGLKLDLTPHSLNFLPNIDISSIHFMLMHCRLILNFPNYAATIPLEGSIDSHKHQLTLKAVSPHATFSYNHEGIKKTVETALNINSLTFNRDTLKISECDIDIEKFPIFALKTFKSELPDFPYGLNFTGKISVIADKLTLHGQIENPTIPQLPRYLDFNAETNCDIFKETKFIHATISNKGTNILTVKAEKNPSHHWEPLQLDISTLNINQLLASPESFWINYLVSTFPKVKTTVSSATISSFAIGQAKITIMKTVQGEINISLDGMIAQGKLTLIARNISLNKNELPETVMATLEIKDAADTLMKFSKNLPAILDCTPTQGNGELAIMYKRAADSTKQGQTKVQLKLQDVNIPTLGSGKVITTLAAIPSILNRLNKLCYNPLLEENPPSAQLIEPFTDITFDSLSVSYETGNNNAIRLSSIEARSKEIGDIQGRLFRLTPNSMRFILNFFNLPRDTVAQANLSANSSQAYNDFIRKAPLQLSLTDTDTTSNENNYFIEDIYRLWLSNQTLTRTEAGDRQ